MAEKYEYEVLRVHPEYKELLKTLVEKSDLNSQIEYVEKMILYFKETGLQPTDRKEIITDELKNLRNTLVSFIRKQEKEKLNPLIDQFNKVSESLLNYLKTEAVTKDDILKLSRGKEFSQTDSPVVDEKYKNMLSHVKKLVNEFQKNLKTQTIGSGYTVDKSSFDRMKSQIENLN